MPRFSIPRTEARRVPRFSRNWRIACTSRHSSHRSPRARKPRSIARILSRNGTRFCFHRRISTMNRHIRMNRRRLLALGGAALVSAGISGRLYAAPSAGPRFLLVFLRGGYDSTNLLIPYSSSFYYEARPTIAISRPDASSNSSALALDGDWALAPTVRDTIGAMYMQRQVAFVPFAGTDDLSRSHFETQDSIELGQPAAGSRNYRSGFLGRLSEILVGSSGINSSIAFTDALPLAFEGSATVPN